MCSVGRSGHGTQRNGFDSSVTTDGRPFFVRRRFVKTGLELSGRRVSGSCCDSSSARQQPVSAGTHVEKDRTSIGGLQFESCEPRLNL